MNSDSEKLSTLQQYVRDYLDSLPEDERTTEDQMLEEGLQGTLMSHTTKIKRTVVLDFANWMLETHKEHVFHEAKEFIELINRGEY